MKDYPSHVDPQPIDAWPIWGRTVRLSQPEPLEFNESGVLIQRELLERQVAHLRACWEETCHLLHAALPADDGWELVRDDLHVEEGDSEPLEGCVEFRRGAVEGIDFWVLAEDRRDHGEPEISVSVRLAYASRASDDFEAIGCGLGCVAMPLFVLSTAAAIWWFLSQRHGDRGGWQFATMVAVLALLVALVAGIVVVNLPRLAARRSPPGSAVRQQWGPLTRALAEKWSAGVPPENGAGSNRQPSGP